MLQPCSPEFMTSAKKTPRKMFPFESTETFGENLVEKGL